MKVLIADTFEDAGRTAIAAAGCEVIYRPELSDESLVSALASTGADVLVVRSTKVTEAMLEGSSLSLIVRAGAGVNTIDVGAASRRGIYVSNCPGKNAIAVAELAFALILAIDRRIADNVADSRAGKWNKKEYSKARGLYGRTLGILGFGSIGQEVARRAIAFGMPVVVWSRRFEQVSAEAAKTEQDFGVTIAGSPIEVAERADVLTVHLALATETRGIVDEKLLGRLKRGSYVINTARAEIIDQLALEQALRAGAIWAGLDVFAHEPAAATGSFDDPLAMLPNVVGTHHIGASTQQAQDAIAAEAARIIREYKETGRVPNVVNLATKTPATHMLVVRHRDRPGVLAHVFDHLRAGNLNVQETANVIFEGAEAAIARINLDGKPSPALLETIEQGNQDILNLYVVRI